jgi:hypothetical protein
MEDIRTYGLSEDEEWIVPDDEREYETSPKDEVPFHIPRD